MTKNISYYHYGVLIIAQGVWREKDKELVNKKIIELKIDDLYKKSFPDNCEICTQIHTMFNEIQGSQNTIEYICNLHLELESIIKLVDYLQTESLVKKMYIFQGGPVLSKKKKDKIIIKDRLSFKTIIFEEFINSLIDKAFEEEILYEVRKF